MCLQNTITPGDNKARKIFLHKDQIQCHEIIGIGIIWNGVIWLPDMKSPFSYDSNVLLAKFLVDNRKTTWQTEQEMKDSILWQKPHQQKIKKVKQQHTHIHTTRNQNLRVHNDCDRLRTVRWSSDSHATGMVKQVYSIPTLPTNWNSSVT